MFDVDPITGMLTKVKRIIPSFAPKPTNVNPYSRTGTIPRLRHAKKAKRQPKGCPNYSAKELAKQQKAVADYHRRLDPKYRKRMEGRARAIAMQAERKLMEEHKANKPTVEA